MLKQGYPAYSYFIISNIRYKDEYWINKLKSEKENWNANNLNSKNDEEFISYIINKKGKRLNSYLSKYIARRLSEPFLTRIIGGSHQTIMIDNKYIKSDELIVKACRFLDSFENENIYGIITTNYDLVIEYSLGTKKFKYSDENTMLFGMGNNTSFPWQNTPVIADGQILLSKLHGSISYDGESYWTTGKCGINGDAKILPPSPEKTRDLRFKHAWDNAENILNNIEKLIVFGFSFNEYDMAILDLLKSNTKNIKEIHIHDIESKMKKVKDIWPNKKIVEHLI